MIKLKTLTPFLPLVLLVGCSNPADTVPKANVSSSTNAPAGTASKPSEAGGKYYAFGPDSSSVEFIGSKVTGRHHGGFLWIPRQMGSPYSQLGLRRPKDMPATPPPYNRI